MDVGIYYFEYSKKKGEEGRVDDVVHPKKQT
jgi:hypothetical protein